MAAYSERDGGGGAAGVGGAVGEWLGRGEGGGARAGVFVAMDAWREGDWEEEGKVR